MKKTGSLILSLFLAVSLSFLGGMPRAQAQEIDSPITQTSTNERQEDAVSEETSTDAAAKEVISEEKTYKTPETDASSKAPAGSEAPVSPEAAQATSLLRAPAQATVSTEQELKDAIAAAPAGQKTDIVLSGDITVSETITVPAGKDVRLTTNGASASLVAASPSISYLMSVEATAALTIDGDVTFDGASKAYYVTCAGALTLENGVMKNGSSASSPAGGVYVYGSSATFTMNGGTISNTELVYSNNGAVHLDKGATGTMNGGTIENTAIKNQFSGSVLVSQSSFTMTGGTITGGDGGQQIQTAGGVMVLALDHSNKGVTSSFTMTGGAITGNKAPFGGGVYVYGGSPQYADFHSKAYFTMNGGSIDNNKATGVVAADGSFISGGGGGVYVQCGGNFTLNDGSISNNIATGMGGAVATFDMFTDYFGKKPYSEAAGQYYDINYKDWPDFYPASFTMNGGSLKNNTATGTDITSDAGCGGAVYSASHNVVLNAGEIIGNKADRQGGGAYVGSVPYSLTAYNAEVTSNTASVIGGGAWFCPTGEASFSVNEGSVVYGNTAAGAGDDIAAVRMQNNGAKTNIAERMLGGGSYNWHKDGGILTPHVLGEPDPDAPRADAGGEAVKDVHDSTESWALKASPSATGIALAHAKAKLTISDNSAARGGGIGSNGEVTLGNPVTEAKQLTVKKVWNTTPSPSATVPESLTVWLVVNGQRTESVTLSAANNWTHTFTGLPMDAEATIEEDVPEGWMQTTETKVISSTSTEITLTNTIKPTPETTHISVKKVWVGKKGSSVTIHLLADGQDTGKTLTLSEANGWSGTFDALEKNAADGHEIAYTVTEDEVSGYTSKVEGSATDGFTVTNTETPQDTPKPKKDRPRKVPDMGDTSLSGVVIPLALGACILLGAGVYLRRSNAQ